jgi:hypothetical protein
MPEDDVRSERERALVDAIARMLAASGVVDSVVHESMVLSQPPRHVWTRTLADHKRYVRITPLPAGHADIPYDLLGGTYASADPQKDFDGRRCGDLPFIEMIVRRWLVQLEDWNALPLGG